MHCIFGYCYNIPQRLKTFCAPGTHLQVRRYLVFLRIDSRPQEGGFPAVHVLLRVTGQLDLPQVFIHVPERKTVHHIRRIPEG